jgi:hypothetical protein
LSVDFTSPSFEAPDFGPERRIGSALAEPLAPLLLSEGRLPGASPAFDWFLGPWSAVEESRGGEAGVWLSSARRGGELCAGAGEFVVSLPVSAAAAALLSSSAPKLSVPCDGSGRAGLCGAPWNDTLVGASDVTLYTGCLSR